MEYSRQLVENIFRTQEIFGLRAQGEEFLSVITKAVDCRESALLFQEDPADDYRLLACLPAEGTNRLSQVKVAGGDSLVRNLSKTGKSVKPTEPSVGKALVKDDNTTFSGVQIILPLVSRARLVGLVVLGETNSDEHSPDVLESLNLAASIIANSLEKECLREQSEAYAIELTRINDLAGIIAASFDIPEVFPAFIKNLEKVIDVQWAAIVTDRNNQPEIFASFPELKSKDKSEEVFNQGTTGKNWLATFKRTLVQEGKTINNQTVVLVDKYYDGTGSIAYLPMPVNGEPRGLLIVVSAKGEDFTTREISFLEKLAVQITMPVLNAQLYLEIEEKSRIDELTGLLNRRALDEVLGNEVNRQARYGGVFTLIIFDLDDFKIVNDTHGHPAGDRLLSEIGAATQNAVRLSDYAFRYGGDELAVLLPHTSSEMAGGVVERLRRQISEVKLGEIGPVTSSLGMATWPANGKTAKEIIVAADAALYAAKRSGGNRVERA